MNRKRLILIWLLALVILALIIWRSASVEVVPESAGTSMDSPAEFDARIKEAEAKKGAPLTVDEKIALLPAKEALLAKKASRMDAEDVSFYAKVVDQYGEPVSGAYFRASVMGSMLGGYTPLSGHADDSGRLRITATGAGITIMAIEKPGYVFTSVECPYPNEPSCYFSAQDFFAAADRQPGEKTWYDHKTPETAYTFKMHRLGYVDGVEQGGIGLAPPQDGGWQSYKLFPYEPNRDLRWSTDPSFPGHIRARLLDTSKDNWKIEIQAVNGGIQLAPKDDAYMSIAPESGYQETFVFECKRDGNCRAGNPRRFYFYSNGGKEYGAMVVSIGGGLDGLYRINTKGGRDLNMSDLKKFDLNGKYR